MANSSILYDIYENTDYGWWFDFSSSVDPEWSIGSSVGYLQLYSSGCYNSTRKEWNCTAACFDPPSVTLPFWNTTNATYTLQNCLVYPVIAHLLAGGKLTSHAVTLAHNYHIEANANLWSNNSAGWPVINNCISDFCENDDKGIAPGCKAKPVSGDRWVFAPNYTYYNAHSSDNSYLNVTLRSVSPICSPTLGVELIISCRMP
jgi:hypothetical protein